MRSKWSLVSITSAFWYLFELSGRIPRLNKCTVRASSGSFKGQLFILEALIHLELTFEMALGGDLIPLFSYVRLVV